MATYKQIQEYVARKYNVNVKTWIAEVRDIHGLTRGPIHNKKGPEKKYPCLLKVLEYERRCLETFWNDSTRVTDANFASLELADTYIMTLGKESCHLIVSRENCQVEPNNL